LQAEKRHPDVPLFVVLEGTVWITKAGEDEKILVVREPGQFTGEMSVISGSLSILTARISTVD
jgi:thioredoxin reductase (NADPH)